MVTGDWLFISHVFRVGLNILYTQYTPSRMVPVSILKYASHAARGWLRFTAQPPFVDWIPMIHQPSGVYQTFSVVLPFFETRDISLILLDAHDQWLTFNVCRISDRWTVGSEEVQFSSCIQSTLEKRRTHYASATTLHGWKGLYATWPSILADKTCKIRP